MRSPAVAGRKQDKTSPKSAKAATTAAASYSHPIPQPAEIIDALKVSGVPTSFAALAEAFALAGDKEQKRLEKRLGKLLAFNLRRAVEAKYARRPTPVGGHASIGGAA